MAANKSNRNSIAQKPKTLLQQLAAEPQILFSGAFRQQYAALCFRYRNGGPDVEVLVMTSRGSGRWVIPKGWPMKKKKAHEVAAIEAWEEAGVKGKVRKDPVGRYTYLKWLENGDVAPAIVDIYEVEVLAMADGFKEKGQRELAWVSPAEAARRVREVELKSFLVEFRPGAEANRRNGKLSDG